MFILISLIEKTLNMEMIFVSFMTIILKIIIKDPVKKVKIVFFQFTIVNIYNLFHIIFLIQIIISFGFIYLIN